MTIKFLNWLIEINIVPLKVKKGKTKEGLKYKEYTPAQIDYLYKKSVLKKAGR